MDVPSSSYDFCSLVKAEIEGAQIAVAVPKIQWNRCLLLYAHGYRPEGTKLQADLDPTEEAWKQLIQRGWIIGMTSYRREGIIVRDAIKDVNNVRNYIVNEYGIPYMTILEGRSMGGAIVTHIAELENVSSLYQGVLAIGAALYAKDPVNPLSFAHSPQIPILYLTNVTETGSIQAYIDQCRKNNAEIVPALWEISREGHNWVNQDEIYNAVDNLLQWIHYGTFITRRQWNNTVLKAPVPSKVRFEEANKFVSGGWGKVTTTNVHNSIGTSFQEQDLNKLGIRLGTKFKMICNGKETIVNYACYPFISYPDGAWICFEEPEGFIMFCINSFKYRNSMEQAGLSIGDEFYIETTLKPPKQK